MRDPAPEDWQGLGSTWRTQLELQWGRDERLMAAWESDAKTLRSRLTCAKDRMLNTGLATIPVVQALRDVCARVDVIMSDLVKEARLCLPLQRASEEECVLCRNTLRFATSSAWHYCTSRLSFRVVGDR